MDTRSVQDTQSVIEKYSKLVFGLALSKTGSKSDAEDVFQETFLAYHRCSKRFSDDEHIKAWLIRTTINQSRRVTSNPWRKRRADLEGDSPEGGDFTLATEEQTIVHNAVNSLPEKYRIPIWLFYFVDMPTLSIGQVLDLPDNTVRSRLSRGRAMLKGILGDKEDIL